MPLTPGSDRATISRNISELTHHGSRPRSHDQIVAIALSNADRHPHRAAGGIGLPHGSSTTIPHFRTPSGGIGMGGSTPFFVRSESRDMNRAGHGIGMPHMDAGGTPWTTRQEAYQINQINDVPFQGGGLIPGSGAGRTDRIPLAVGSDSHVLPADVVAGVGQNHNLAGARILQAALSTGPFGVSLPHAVHANTIPHPPSATQAEGGRPPTTSILGASGEVVIPPHDVEALGRRAHERGAAKKGESPMDTGHRLLDEMIARVRKFQIEWLRNAPPPKK